MRIAIAVAVSCLSIVGMTATAQVHAAIRKHAEIPPESLDLALHTLARDRGFQLVYLTENVAALQTRGAIGDFTVDEALKKLLSDSQLEYKFVDDNTVSIFPKTSPTSALGKDRTRTSGSDQDSSGSASKRSTGEHFRLAQEDPGSTSHATSVAASTSDSSGSPIERVGLAEIIVTAQKKIERLQDVPVPVTALDADTLAERNQNRLQDYFATVPGLSLATTGSYGGGQQSLAIRGVTTGVVSNPTVGVTIDDVPYGSSTILGLGALLVPDIDPSDLANVEVLRGPQGALYGVSSIGGLVKFVTKDPSTEGFSGRVQVLGDSVEHGDAGYGVRGAVNMPLSDTFAIRASAFTRRDPGYVDNVLTGQNDVNQVDVNGGRIAALWRPSDSLSIKLSALLQNTDGKGTPAIDAGTPATNGNLQSTLGDLKQARLPGTETYHTDSQLYSAILTTKFADVELTSISAYGNDTYRQFGDTLAVNGGGSGNNFETKKFSQELRLASIAGSRIEWLVGAFYTHEDTASDQFWESIDKVTGAGTGLLIDFNYPNSLSEYAAFGDLTVHFTDRFDVQFGGRDSEIRQVYNETDSGPYATGFYGSNPFVNETERTNGNAFTYLLTPRFRFSPDLMVYARFTSGYRVGGVNVNAVALQIPIRYAPDKTNNYELGLKADWFDHTLSVDASAFYIDWKQIQIALIDQNNGFGYNANGGKAKSQGLELSLQARPATGLTLAATATVLDAELAQDLPATSSAIGLSGERLPYSSRFSGSLSADQDIALTGKLTGFMGATLSYVGTRSGEFVSVPLPPNLPPSRVRFPAYGDLDVRAGLRFGSFTANLFVNNACDRRGIVGGGISFAESPYDILYIQPRTVGLSIAEAF